MPVYMLVTMTIARYDSAPLVTDGANDGSETSPHMEQNASTQLPTFAYDASGFGHSIPTGAFFNQDFLNRLYSPNSCRAFRAALLAGWRVSN
jgi:hypothetical protein